MTARTSSRPAPSRAEENLRAFHEEHASAKAFEWEHVRRLFVYARPHAKFVLGSFTALLCMTGVNLVRPIVMGDIVRQALAVRADLLFRDGALLCGLVVVLEGTRFVQTYTMRVAGARTLSDLRCHIFMLFQTLQLSYFDRTPVGRLVTRATNDVDAIGDVFTSGGVLNAIGALLGLGGVVGMMLFLDWRLSLAAFAVLPVVGLLWSYTRNRSRRALREVRAKTARLNAFLHEQVGGLAVVQAYAREEAMAKEFDDISKAHRDALKQSVVYDTVIDGATYLATYVAIASVLWSAGLQKAGTHPVIFATIVTFAQYTIQFFEGLFVLSTQYQVVQGGIVAAERIYELLDARERETPPLSRAECDPDGPPDEAILFRNVCSEYKEGSPVVNDVSFTAKKGEKIAFVGATGAGKTTVSSLILRLYEAKSGTIRVLGKDVRSYDRHALRENFSVVPQDVFLFAGTVLSNVAVSDPKPDRERAARALERVGALEVFMRRSGGLDAVVAERGSNLSGGERQLLAYARAIYRDAPILILDEATSSVDSNTEARLQVALEAAVKGRTAIVIAHRLSTIRAADRILAFHHGRVVESGTHRELMSKNGVYARLYRLHSAQERVAQLEYTMSLNALAQTRNRRYFLDQLEKELAYARRHQTPLSLLMLDVDNLKAVNDKWGHSTVDGVLLHVARIAMDVVRTEDIFARYGGGEFVVLCRGENAAGGARLAERLRERVEELRVMEAREPLRVTISVGVASHPELDAKQPAVLIEAVEQALYAAKRAGRNRVVIWHPTA
jgi:ATP-binding cassette subfamily B multidrug efflux pump